jgi:hypothetical protein
MEERVVRRVAPQPRASASRRDGAVRGKSKEQDCQGLGGRAGGGRDGRHTCLALKTRRCLLGPGNNLLALKANRRRAEHGPDPPHLVAEY